MTSAIVTGASGFVGRWLVESLLEQNFKVLVLLRKESTRTELMKIESNNLKILYVNYSELNDIVHDITQEYEVFYHLAWEGAGGSKRADYNIQINNVKLALDCFHFAEKLNCKKFIGIGTIGEFMAELAVQNNITSQNYTYAMCKNLCYKLLRLNANNSNCKVVWCTLGGLYGPNDTTQNLVNYTINTLIKGEMPNYGPADQLFDFIYIKDCVNALIKVGVSDKIPNQVYIGSGTPHKLKDYLSSIGELINPDVPLGIGLRPDDGTVYLEEWFDTSVLNNIIGFRPSYTFEEGVIETVFSIKGVKNGI